MMSICSALSKVKSAQGHINVQLSTLCSSQVLDSHGYVPRILSIMPISIVVVFCMQKSKQPIAGFSRLM